MPIPITKSQAPESPLAIKANIDELDQYGWSALHNAARNSDVEEVRLLLLNGASQCLANKSGNTALHIAAINDRTDVVEHLLNNGLWLDLPNENSLDLANQDGRTALHFAAQKGHINIVKLLLEYGARSDLVDKEGKTALEIATDNNNTIVIETLKAEFMKFFVAAHKGDVDTVKALVSRQNVNDTFNRYPVGPTTALHIASEANQYEVVKVLLEVEGVDVDPVNGKGETPLLTAAYLGYDDDKAIAIIDLLMQKGANPNAVDNKGNNALHLAIDEDKLELIKGLIDLGIDVNATNNEGKTPLHFAILKGRLKSVKTLLDLNASPFLVDKDNKTYLHVLAGSQKGSAYDIRDIIIRFIAEGVDIDVVDKEGKTALQIATDKNNTIVINTLEEVKLILEKNSKADEAKIEVTKILEIPQQPTITGFRSIFQAEESKQKKSESKSNKVLNNNKPDNNKPPVTVKPVSQKIKNVQYIMPANKTSITLGQSDKSAFSPPKKGGRR